MTATPSTGLPEAMALMVDGHFRHLPIVDRGRVIGMISMRDLMAWASLRLRHGGVRGRRRRGHRRAHRDDPPHAYRRRVGEAAVGATLADDARGARGGHPRGPGLTGLVASLSGAGRGVPAPLLLVAAIVCIQTGAAATTALFDEVGVHGSTFARTFAAGAVLLLVARPRVRGRERADWLAVGVFAPARGDDDPLPAGHRPVPLAVVVTLEFLGPLGVALLGSRRLVDLLWVGLAAGGVLLFAGDPTSAGGDWLGVAMALGAGLGWAAYILVAQRVGSRWEGSQGLALSFAGAAVLLAPLGVHEAGTDLLRPDVVVIALLVGTIAGALPFALEFAALRRLPARTYGVLVSLEPAVAAVVGVIALAQTPRVTEVVAVLLVVAASIGATRAARPPDPL